MDQSEGSVALYMGESHQVLIKALDPAAGDTNASLASTKETMTRVLFGGSFLFPV